MLRFWRSNVFGTGLCLLVLLFVGYAKAGAQELPNAKKYDYIVVISTMYGDIELMLFDQTPAHKKNFVKLVHEGFYDSCTFHRVLDNFMIQSGDPHSKPDTEGEIGMGGPGYELPAEIKEGLVHDPGALGAARQGDGLNPARVSSGSQFYIIESSEGAHHLDGQYTVFGKVLKGMEVVNVIAAQSVSYEGSPYEPIYIKAKYIVMKKKSITKVYGYEYPGRKKKKSGRNK